MAESPNRSASVRPPALVLNPQETLTADTFMRGLWKDNPVFVMLLGMCPTLAVTNTAINALGMGLATTFVLVGSGVLVSLLRNWIPKQVRIASYIVIIATFVTVVDYGIQAISLELYAALGAFIQLIVVNCVILGRAEAYASKQRLHTTLVNSLGMGAGFTLALLALGVVREILGNGSLFGIALFGTGFQPWVIMVLPPGGFFVLGTWLLLFNWLRLRKERKAMQQSGVAANAG
jgi:electron transport complex protein RnfE